MKNLIKTKNKKIITTLSLIVIFIITLGISYAGFVHKEITNNQQIVLGDIYMYANNNTGLVLYNALPGDGYVSYFEFTVSGKNEYTESDIYYEIVLNKGTTPEGKDEANRYKDKDLKFQLTKVNEDGTETVLVTDKTYTNLTNQRLYVETIPKRSQSEINNTYRLYTALSDDLTICGAGITTGCDYYVEGETNNWNNGFANVNVSVIGDLLYKEAPVEPINWFDEIVISKHTKENPTYIREDGITYLSGDSDTINFNYVWYSGKLWRITAIYPDGTMKMITDGLMTTIAYGESDDKFYTDENTTSYMYQWLNQEFLPTLYNYENIIVEDATWNASPGDETISSKLPIEGQDEVLVNASVGLLNSYEYYKSYQNASSYDSGYLNIGYYWWLLNPYDASYWDVWLVGIRGDGFGLGPGNTYGGRPSIYLKSGVLLKGGTGTESNPYRIIGDQEEAEANVTLIKTRQSGEYVNFDEELYRIVGIENETTKLIKDDYVKDESSTILTKAFASSTTFGKDTNDQTDSYWDYYLNKTWKPAIEDDYEKMLVEGTYYIKSVTGGNYKKTACSTISNKTSIKDCDKTGVSTWTGYVGFPRYGEMFASQTSNAGDMYLITPYGSSYVWGVNGSGFVDFESPSYTRGGRPTINLKSEIVIKSGSGTKQDPFVVGLPT